MNRILKFFKSNVKFFAGIIIGISVSTITVYAAASFLFNSDEVGYDNSLTGFKDSTGNDVTDVKTALDELYGTSKEISDKLVVGTEVTISGEDFYVISANKDETVLVSKYNLLVGNMCKSDDSCVLIDSNTIGYGKQNVSGSGTLSFSGTNYWSGNVGGDLYPGSYSGSNYPYVFDSNSNLKVLLDNYKLLLGDVVKDIRLMTSHEAISLGCYSFTDNSCPSWIRNTSFWLGSAISDDMVWTIGVNNGKIDSSSYLNQSGFGVRPVIVVNTSDITSQMLQSSCPLNSDCVKKVGAEYIIGGDPFIVIKSDLFDTTLISKYNLFLGNNCESESLCLGIESSLEGYGKQSVSAIGFVDSYPVTAVIDFSGTNYWASGVSDLYSSSNYPYVFNSNSNLYSLLDNYKVFLNSNGGNVKDIRLLSYQDSVLLGCTTTSSSCPLWIKNTSFWLGSAASDDNVWVLNSLYGKLINVPYYTSNSNGIRPVIVVNTSDI